MALDARHSGGNSPSPRELINAVIANGPAALLKAAGFGKRGKKFHLAESESSAHVDFQGTFTNSRERTSFTINLGRYFPALAEPLGQKVIADPAKRTWWHCGTRIGHVMKTVQKDYWWELTSVFEVASVGASVTAALREYGIPFLHSCATLEGMVAENPLIPQWMDGQRPSEVRAAALSILGREDEAQAVRAQLQEWERERRDRRGLT